MTVTGAHVHQVLAKVGAVGGQVASVDALAAGLDDALRQAPKGLTKEGAAAFAATMAMESASFRTTEEYAKDGDYAPYIGRTFEQLTWRDAYAGFGTWLHDKKLLTDAAQFVKNPKSLADLRWAWLGGVWYWEAHDLWPHANQGNFLWVSQYVNGGAKNAGTNWTPNGWTARKAWYNAFLSLGAVLLPTAPAAPAPKPKTPFPLPKGQTYGMHTHNGYGTTPQDQADKNNIHHIKVQLRALGYRGPTILSGGIEAYHWNDALTKQVKQFQHDKGMSQTGEVGAETWAHLFA